jgi:hypothetical protein
MAQPTEERAADQRQEGPAFADRAKTEVALATCPQILLVGSSLAFSDPKAIGRAPYGYRPQVQSWIETHYRDLFGPVDHPRHQEDARLLAGVTLALAGRKELFVADLAVGNGERLTILADWLKKAGHSLRLYGVNDPNIFPHASRFIPGLEMVSMKDWRDLTHIPTNDAWMNEQIDVAVLAGNWAPFLDIKMLEVPSGYRERVPASARDKGGQQAAFFGYAHLLRPNGVLVIDTRNPFLMNYLQKIGDSQYAENILSDAKNIIYPGNDPGYTGAHRIARPH